MCLGKPGKVVKVEGRDAVVDYGGIKKEVDGILMPDLEPGDHVIVHAGAIISKISEERYKELIETLNEMARLSHPS